MLHQRQKTKAIILQKNDFGEADQVFTLFSQNFGKINLSAKSIRKITSKLRAVVGIYNLFEVDFIEGRFRRTIVDGVILKKHSNILNDFQLQESAFLISSALQNLTFEKQKDPELWRIVRQVFSFLAENSPKLCNPLLVYYFFFWKMADILGYFPQVDLCPICQKKLLPETIFFVPQEGGVCCWQCLKGSQLAFEQILPNTVKVLRVFKKAKISILSKLKIDDHLLENLGFITCSYLIFLSENLKRK